MSFKGLTEAQIGAGQAIPGAQLSEEELKEQYLKEMWESEQAEIAAQQGEDFVLDEAHPALGGAKGFMTRGVFKNLAPNSDVGFNYLQQEYPDLDWKTDKEGGVLVRDPKTEKAWRKLDPSETEFSDITDAGYDILAGGAETVGSAVGGIGGGFAGLMGGPAAPVTVPLGAMAGAAGGGAAVGAGMEGLRQKMGQWAGMPTDEMDTGAIGDAAIWGAASPLLLGTGAVTKPIMKAGGKSIAKSLLKTGAKKYGSQKQALKEVIEGQSGIFGKSFRGAKKSMGYAGAAASGIDKEMLDWAAKNMDKIKFAESQPYGSEELLLELRDTLTDSFEANRKQIGDSIGKALKTKGVHQLEVDQPLAYFDDVVGKYQQIYNDKPTPKALEDLTFVQDVRKKLFSVVKQADEADGIVDDMAEEFIESVDINAGLSLMDDLNTYTNIRKPQLPGADVRTGRMDPVEREVQNAARKAADVFNNSIEGTLGPKYASLKRDYAKMMNAGKTLNKYFKDPVKAESTMNSFYSPKKSQTRKEILEVGDLLGKKVGDKARDLAGIGLFAKPSDDVAGMWRGAVKKAPMAGLGGALGFMAGTGITDDYSQALPFAALGAGAGAALASPRAMRKYIENYQKMSKPWRTMQQKQLPGIPGSISPAMPQTLMNINEQMEMNKR